MTFWCVGAKAGDGRKPPKWGTAASFHATSAKAAKTVKSPLSSPTKGRGARVAGCRGGGRTRGGKQPPGDLLLVCRGAGATAGLS